jgi:hypothetical protein
LLHFNVTEHPTSEWTRAAAAGGASGRSGLQVSFARSNTRRSSASLDETVESWGIHVVRSPVRMPTANAHCERLIGSIRRECLDYLIPLNASICGEPSVSGPVVTMLAGRIARWDRAFLTESNRLLSSKLPNYPRLHV